MNGGFQANQIQIRLDDGARPARPRGAISLQRLAHKVPKQAGKEFKQARREREHDRFAQAERHYVKALELDPQFLEGANDLGALYYGLGRFPDALRVIEQAQAIDNNSPIVLSNLAAALMALQRPLEAERFARRAFALDPAQLRVRYLYALSRAASNRADGEVRAMLLEVADAIPRAYLALANLYTIEGNRAEARLAVERYLAATKPPPGALRNEAEGWLNALR